MSDPNATNVTPEPIAEETAPTLDFTTAGLLVGMANLHASEAKEMQEKVREAFRQQLADLHEKTGTRSVNLALPDGTKFGQATFSESKAATVIDSPNAFEAWVVENFPDQIETVTQVKPGFAARILSEVLWSDVEVPVEAEADPDDPWSVMGDDAPAQDDGDTTEPETRVEHLAIHAPDGVPSGVVIPGLRFVPATLNTKSFTLTFDKPKAGAARTEKNMRTGREVVAAFMKDNPINALLPTGQDPAAAIEA